MSCDICDNRTVILPEEGADAEIAKKLAAMETGLGALQDTVKKIAEQTTDGHVTSATPGQPGAASGKFIA